MLETLFFAMDELKELLEEWRNQSNEIINKDYSFQGDMIFFTLTVTVDKPFVKSISFKAECHASVEDVEKCIEAMEDKKDKIFGD